jgi:hypothetical protein
MKKALIFLMAFGLILTFCACGTVESSAATVTAQQDRNNTLSIGDKLTSNQPTPTDIDYSLERYNLIKRTYWVNGQREKANTLLCAIDKPLGYIILLTDNGAVVGSFIVDGKISSLNSFLTPDSEYYEYSAGETSRKNQWLPDVDGSYGENDSGIFFFTPDGKYIEWTGTYLYSDIPFIVDDPIVKVGNANE